MADKANPVAAGDGAGLGISSRLAADDPRNIISSVRFQYLAGRLHALGPGPLAHFLAEVAAGAEVIEHAEHYARLPCAFVHALGGDRLPERLWVIEGGRR